MDPSVGEVETYFDEFLRADIQWHDKDNTGNGKAKLKEKASARTIKPNTGCDTTRAERRRAKIRARQTQAVRVNPQAKSLKVIEECYVALLNDASITLDEMGVLKELYGPDAKGQMSYSGASTEAQASMVVRVHTLGGVHTVAEQIEAKGTKDVKPGLDRAVKDLRDLAQWLRMAEHLYDSCGRNAIFRGCNESGKIREALVERTEALKVLLPETLQQIGDLAMMHAEHEVLDRKFVNGETMLDDPVSSIPRANFWSSEDGYAWDMEELSTAIRSSKGVMRNPLTRIMFTKSDIAAILHRPLGQGLEDFQMQQSKLKQCVQPQTVRELDKLASALLYKASQNENPSRVAVKSFVSYLVTLPGTEQEAIQELKIPAMHSHSGMEYDGTIGETVNDAHRNRVSLHKAGVFLAQAVKYLR